MLDDAPEVVVLVDQPFETSDSNRRPDVRVAADGYELIIETKVFAGEQENQCAHYRKMAESRADAVHCVFLTRDGRSPETGEEGHWEPLSFARLRDTVIEFANARDLATSTRQFLLTWALEIDEGAVPERQRRRFRNHFQELCDGESRTDDIRRFHLLDSLGRIHGQSLYSEMTKMEEMTELARAYLDASPFLEQARKEAEACLDQALEQAATNLVEDDAWRLVRKDGKPMLVFSPPPFAAPFAAIILHRDDQLGVELRCQGQPTAQSWVACFDQKAADGLESSFDVDPAYWKPGDEELSVRLDDLSREVEGAFERWVHVNEPMQRFRSAREPLHLCCVGRDPWQIGTAEYAEVRYAIAQESVKPVHLTQWNNGEPQVGPQLNPVTSSTLMGFSYRIEWP